MAFVHVGHGGFVNAEHIVQASSGRAQPIDKLVARAKRAHRLVDLTHGKPTRATLFMSDGSVTLISISPETLAARVARGNGPEFKS